MLLFFLKIGNGALLDFKFRLHLLFFIIFRYVLICGSCRLKCWRHWSSTWRSKYLSAWHSSGPNSLSRGSSWKVWPHRNRCCTSRPRRICGLWI